MQSFDLRFNLVEDSSTSIMAALSSFLVPLFTPLGLGDWRVVTSLITGFIAKESVVSTMNILFSGGVENALTAVTAATLLVFSLLYSPCVAAIAAIKRELGALYALAVVLWQCAIAWIVAFILKFIFVAMGM